MWIFNIDRGLGTNGEHVDGDSMTEREGAVHAANRPRLAGIDARKGHHRLVLIDGERCRLSSCRGANDEAELTAAIDAVLQWAKQVTYTIELADGPAAHAIRLLLERGQRLLYLPGVAVNRTSDAYRCEDKTGGPRTPRSVPIKLPRAATRVSCTLRHHDRRAAHPDRSSLRPHG